MKQVTNAAGEPIKGIFRNDDGSIVIINYTELKKSKLSHAAFESLNNEVQELKKQMKQILEHIHG